MFQNVCQIGPTLRGSFFSSDGWGLRGARTSQCLMLTTRHSGFHCYVGLSPNFSLTVPVQFRLGYIAVSAEWRQLSWSLELFVRPRSHAKKFRFFWEFELPKRVRSHANFLPISQICWDFEFPKNFSGHTYFFIIHFFAKPKSLETPISVQLIRGTLSLKGHCLKKASNPNQKYNSAPSRRKVVSGSQMFSVLDLAVHKHARERSRQRMKRLTRARLTD